MLSKRCRLKPVSKNTPRGGKKIAQRILIKSMSSPFSCKWNPHLSFMMSLLFFVLFASAGELDYQTPPVEVRCSFLSPSKTVVRHHFKIHSDLDKRGCDYGITVDDKVILVSRAFSQDCRFFMRSQINKGSVCMTNEF